MEEAEILLKEFGLTEYESKSYITLLKLGIATAEQISETASIPLPRVYDTLVELQKKGFVLISKGRPKRFRPNLPKKALENFVSLRKKEFEKQINDLKNNVGKIANVISKIPSEKKEEEEKKYEIWSTEKRKNIRNILDEQKEMAKKEILIFSGDLSWLKETMNLIKQSIKKGVKIRTIAPVSESEEFLKNIRLAKKIGIDVKIGYKGLMRGHIIDGRIVSIAIKLSPAGLNVPGEGKAGSDFLDKYELITSDNPILVDTFKENFEFWWKKLKQ